MTPETVRHKDAGVRLYKATHFPMQWVFVAQLTSHREQQVDPTVFEHNNTLWMFASGRKKTEGMLYLYFSDRIDKGWMPHPNNPVASSAVFGRPGGRVVKTLDGSLYRFGQSTLYQYGSSVTSLKITQLTRNSYSEVELLQGPTVHRSGSGLVNKGSDKRGLPWYKSARCSEWNCAGMHHVDAHALDSNLWVAAVDGSRATHC